MSEWTLRKRGKAPAMTRKMLAVLCQLREAQHADNPFLRLEDVHGRTLWALTERDWIIESDEPEGTYYRITGRGLNVLQAYETPTRRQDGLCPTCGERPVHVTPTGRRVGYCKPCFNRYQRSYAQQRRKRQFREKLST